MDQVHSAIYNRAGQIFTPGSPVNERDLFAGRLEQLGKIMDATSQRGYHAVLFGERGVGKTSLSNVSSAIWRSGGRLITKVNCDAGDTFETLWRKTFKDITYTQTKPGIGFGAEDVRETKALIEALPDKVTPDDVRRVFAAFVHDAGALIIFDEFDRITDKSQTTLMADAIKALSDYGVNATVLLIGVADSVDELIKGHQSVERTLVQIPMPTMSSVEIGQIIDNGLSLLGMTMDEESRSELIALSQGLPYIAHLLALNTVRAALLRDSSGVLPSDFEAGIDKSLEQWQQSIKVAYYNAVKSPQPGNIYREVLLGCAMAETDDLGFFTASAVRAPLRVVAKRDYDIPNFARHLKEFSEQVRGEILSRGGETRKIRYRFRNPIMKPYVVMRGYADGLLRKKALKRPISE